MQCEMCGRTGQLFKARIEGVELDVCGECARFGTMIARPRPVQQLMQNAAQMQAGRAQVPEKKEILVASFAGIIRKKREQLGLTQEAFARLLAERESLVQKMEAGTFVPSIDMARKMERILKTRLVEEEQDVIAPVSRGSAATFTLGDFVKKK